MFHVVELVRALYLPRVALALISIGLAGCSADMSTRLSQDSFSNPFASQSGAATSAPVSVEPRELPQYPRPQSLAQSSVPTNATSPTYPAAGTSSSGAARGTTSYTPPSQPIKTTGRAAPRSVAANHGSGHGSTTIIVGMKDTLDNLSRRYGVSPAVILQANGYKGPRTLSPGQQLIIPRPTTAAAAPKSKAVAVTTTTPSVHVVNRGDTMLSIARRNHTSITELAKANNLDRSAKLKLGMKLTVPGSKTAAVTPLPRPGAGAPPATTLVSPASKFSAGAPKAGEKTRLPQATTTPAELSTQTPVKATEATATLPTFRWPVRGKVITRYGAKTNGKANEGINLSVPEGTPVRAAEDGVVGYSGNELKSYGNLVLVRHSNGYVTAYAHASEVLVKRGEAIKRGQIIAKSGQSGEVGSPQLHFEIRKGSSPVDPLQFLNGA
jgi:murein DD-endopeptidase MepM/ murein hydrolase activator NlpD